MTNPDKEEKKVAQEAGKEKKKREIKDTVGSAYNSIGKRPSQECAAGEPSSE